MAVGPGIERVLAARVRPEILDERARRFEPDDVQIDAGAQRVQARSEVVVLGEESLRVALAMAEELRNHELLLGLEVDEQAGLKLCPEALNALAIVGFERGEEAFEEAFDRAVVGEEVIVDRGGVGAHAASLRNVCARVQLG